MTRAQCANPCLGFSGKFGAGDLVRLERCLPGAIFYKEPDGQVGREGQGAGLGSMQPTHGLRVLTGVAASPAGQPARQPVGQLPLPKPEVLKVRKERR